MSSPSILKQPAPFYMIFLIEMWERFGWAGLQALLTVYFTQQLNMPESQSFAIFGAFTSLMYGLVAVGGFIGDRILGTKRTLVLGAIILACGYTLLALAGKNHQLVYLGLSTVVIGCAIFKANPASLLAKCYEKTSQSLLDGAFTMYYMAINVGSLISALLVPFIAQKYNWSVALLACAVGLLFSLLSYILQRHTVKNKGSAPDLIPLKINKLIAVIVGAILSIFLSAWLLQHCDTTRALMTTISSAVVMVFIYEIIKAKPHERNKMIAALILIIEAILFFVLYLQMPTSLNFFAINNVEHSILGFHINPISFQALNPFWIITLSPVLATLYQRNSKLGNDLSIPKKFAIGMLCCSISFFLLPLGAQFATSEGIVNSNWLIASYAFQSAGELLISGLGLAMVAQLVPVRLHGFVMGAWFITTAAAAFIGSALASLTAAPRLSGAITGSESLEIYSHVFFNTGLVTLAMFIIMILTAPKLTSMINKSQSGNASSITYQPT